MGENYQKFTQTSSDFGHLFLSCFFTNLDKIQVEKKEFYVFFKMAPIVIFYLFSFRSSVHTKIEGYFSFYACEMIIFYEQNLRCATLKLRPNSLPRPRGRKFRYLERTRPDTANTSRGRVGRGGNACFSTFRLVLTDGRTKPCIESLVRD